MRSKFLISLTSVLLMGTMTLNNVAVAATIRLQHGTPVYVELDQQVTSSTKDFSEGDTVKSHVWRDVVVDGRTLISAGTPVDVRISELKKRKVAGVKGQLELEAFTVDAVDGTQVLLDGGYDKQGRHRIGLAVSLGAIVAWPLIFIRGKNAELNPGTLFDCQVQTEYQIELGADAPVKLNLGAKDKLSIEVLYDTVDPESKEKILPLKITNCESSIDAARVTKVNDQPIEPIQVTLGTSQVNADCTAVEGSIDLESLAKHFRQGINRFEVEVGEQKEEVVLDIEL